MAMIFGLHAISADATLGELRTHWQWADATGIERLFIGVGAPFDRDAPRAYAEQ
jgi:hypothetical protein